MSNEKTILAEIENELRNIKSTLNQSTVPKSPAPTSGLRYRILPKIKTQSQGKSPRIPHYRTKSKMSTIKDVSSPQGLSQIRDYFKLPVKQHQRSVSQSKRHKFFRICNPKILPEANRKDPANFPPEIEPEDVDEGMLKLIYKGMIPKDADLGPAFSRDTPSLLSRQATLNIDRTRSVSPPKTPTPPIFLTSFVPKKSPVKIREPPEFKAIGDPAEFEKREKKEKIRLPGEYNLIVKFGKIVENEDLALFKQDYRANWGILRDSLNKVERFCRKNRLKKVELDGKLFSDTVIDEVSAFKMKKIWNCVRNKGEIHQFQKEEKNRRLAAVHIQKEWRRFTTRRNFLYLKALNKKATIIQSYFNIYRKKLATKRLIEALKRERIERHHVRDNYLRQNWEEIRVKPRFEVHIGSVLPDPYSIDYYTAQNSQMARVCRAIDPSISVIYVSPIPLHSEIVYYYYCLLERCKIERVRQRVFFVHTEHGLSISSDQYSTSKLLSYSFKTINWIKEMTKGKEGYIVPGEMSMDDILVGDLLELPVYSSHLEVIKSFKNRSASMDLLKEAGLNLPVTSDIISQSQLFIPTLASLISQDLYTKQWLVKIENMKKSRGMMLVHVNKSEIINNLNKNTRVTAEKAYKKIVADLKSNIEDYVEFVVPSAWQSYEHFMQSLSENSGIIQKVINGSKASPCICLLIEPDGNTRFTGAFDKFQTNDFLNAGCFFPQTSISQSKIISISQKVSEILYTKGVIGFVTIELVQWMNEKKNDPYFAIDLTVGLDWVSSSMMLFNCLLGGELDIETGNYFIEYIENPEHIDLPEDKFGDDFTNFLTTTMPTDNRSASSEFSFMNQFVRRPNFEDINKFEPRFYSYVFHAEHPGIADLSLGAFFHMCRLENAIFSLEERLGNIFNVYNVPSCRTFGIMGVGTSHFKSIKSLAEIFTFLLQQAGPPPQPVLKFVEAPVDEINLNQILAKIRIISITTEKKLKQGKRGYLNI